MKRVIVLTLAAVTIGLIIGTVMAQSGQAPVPAENASFLHPDSAFKVLHTGTTTIPLTAAPSGASISQGSISVTLPGTYSSPPVVLAFAGSSGTEMLPWGLPTASAAAGIIGYAYLMQHTVNAGSNGAYSVTFTMFNYDIASHGPTAIRYYVVELPAS